MEYLGRKCIINLMGEGDFENFFNGQYGYIVGECENGVKVTPLLLQKCTVELLFNEVIVF